MKKNLISPQVYSFETDKSELYYLNNNTRTIGGSDTVTSGTGPITQNNENNYLLLETGFFLLQEDGSKIIL